MLSGVRSILDRRILVVTALLAFLACCLVPDQALTAPKGESAFPLKSRVIALDPGHGASTGARGPAGTCEDGNNLAIALKLKAKLEAAGAKVVMTRTSDREAFLTDEPWVGPLESIVRISNDAGADLFISIHNNWSYNSSARGIGTYYMPERGTEWLASVIQEELIRATGCRDWGTIPAGFYVLRNTDAPAVLVEIGFISNWEDEQLLLSDWFRGKVAEGLYNGVLRYFGVDPGGKPAVTPVGSGPKVSGGPYEVWGYWAKWGTDPSPLASLRARVGELDFVAPYWYTLMGDGTLKPREDESTRRAVAELTRSGKSRFIVMINNDKTTESMLLDSSIRDKAVKNICDLVTNGGFDGVHIDFEQLSPSTRDYLTEFVKRLWWKLHPDDRLVTVAVVARTGEEGEENSTVAAYDYGALGQFSDRVVVMCYDRHGRWSGPGPVAPVDWVVQAVRYAVSHIPREKILLGIACYGYDWSPAGVESLKAREAVSRALQYGTEIRWDDRAQEANFTYWDSYGVWHEVWFENSFSLERKLDVVESSRIRGIALWSLGQEDERAWDVISRRLRGSNPTQGNDGVPFTDIRGHECEEAVSFLWSKGLIDGYPDGTFKPDSGLSRAEFAKMVVDACDSVGSGSQASASGSIAAVSGFPVDMTPRHWAYQHVLRARDLGLISGYPDGTFRPESPVTRAEMVTMTVRMLEKSSNDGSTGRSSGSERAGVKGDWAPSDVRDHWAGEYVQRAVSLEIMDAFKGSEFMPDKNATRGETALTLAKAIRLRE